MATFYLDYEGGSDAADGTTFANRWKTITSGATAARIAPGDTIRIMASPDQTSLGQSATWTNLSKTVALTTAVTANVDDGEAAWTASASVTSTADTTFFKENTKSAKHVIAAGFVTGLAAYKAFSATDYSAKKQISFWIRNSVAVPASSLSIKLCSDNAGVTSVNTIAIPAIPSINQWVPITVDTAGALGASIQSVALYVDSDFGAVDIYLDNIIACKDSTAADSLTLTSLIGKNTGTETWYGIQSINGTTVKLDNGVNALGSAGRGYYGTTESVTTWKRETIKTTMMSAATTNVQTTQDSGTAGNLITYAGGWDRTAMTSQSGETWFDGQNCFGRGLAVNQTFVSINNLHLCRYQDGFFITNSHLWFDNISANNCEINGIFSNNALGQLFFVTIKSINNNSGNGARFQGQGHFVTSIVQANNNLVAGLTMNQGDYSVGSALAANNQLQGIYSDTRSIGKAVIRNTVTTGNSGGILALGGNFYLKDCSISESTEVSFNSTANARVTSINHDQTANNHLIFTDGGQINSTASVRHTASGIAWQLSPTSTNRSATYPLDTLVTAIAVAANALVTVNLWMRRTNTGITGKLICRGGQLAGVAADVVDTMTAAADTWEQRTITFTPTEAGVIEIEAWAYGGTTYSLYIDDLTVTQA